MSDIADLNKEIAAIKTGKGDANDFRDKRAEALKGLAESSSGGISRITFPVSLSVFL
ncbi:MAG: hypothetical protein J7K15_03125 [Deltaproteobacteria bacterium]|nr:hypothetical protein [Deltaproteobacteria bacterium]